MANAINAYAQKVVIGVSWVMIHAVMGLESNSQIKALVLKKDPLTEYCTATIGICYSKVYCQNL